MRGCRYRARRTLGARSVGERGGTFKLDENGASDTSDYYTDGQSVFAATAFPVNTFAPCGVGRWSSSVRCFEGIHTTNRGEKHAASRCASARSVGRLLVLDACPADRTGAGALTGER